MNRPRAGRLAATAMFAALALAACDPGDGSVLCTMSVREHHTSPDGRFMAVVFDRDCGVRGASTQLGIAPAGGTIPNAPANTFIADRLTVLDVAWDSPERLRVSVPPAVQAQRADTTILGITIRYDERPPAAQRAEP